MKPLYLFLIVLVALAASSSALARTWTDKQGNKSQAKFVRFHDGNVILMRGNKVIKVPFEDLCEEDQEYVRKELKKLGKEDLLPPKSSPSASGDNSTDDSGAREERTWTDVKGRKIRAKMIRLADDGVVLLYKGREVTVPLTNLSPADREYVMEQEAKKNRKKSPPIQPPTGPIQPPTGPIQPPTGPMQPPPMQPPPHFTPPPYQPPVYQPPVYQPPVPPSSPPEIPHPQFTPNLPLPSDSFLHQKQEMAYFCSQCKRQLPPNIGVGDKCPYCRAFLAFEQDQFGKITKRVPVWQYILIGGLVPIIAVVIGIFLRFLRRD